MQLPLLVQSKKYMCTSTIMSQKLCGAAVKQMETLGGETPTSVLEIGLGVSLTWLRMLVFIVNFHIPWAAMLTSIHIGFNLGVTGDNVPPK
jgi:hypothetical protein